MEEISIIKYKAFDGKIFDDKKACEDYENYLNNHDSENNDSRDNISLHTSGISTEQRLEWQSSYSGSIILAAAKNLRTKSFILREEVNLKNTIRAIENRNQFNVTGSDLSIRLVDLSIEKNLSTYNQWQQSIMRESLEEGIAVGLVSIHKEQKEGSPGGFRLMEDERGFHNEWTYEWVFLRPIDCRMLILSDIDNAKAWVGLLDEFDKSKPTPKS